MGADDLGNRSSVIALEPSIAPWSDHGACQEVIHTSVRASEHGVGRKAGANPPVAGSHAMWRIESEYGILPAMQLRSCRVTIQDMDGVSHTVEVTAATLYEAVGQGLAAIRGNEWVAGIAQGTRS
jgi:hypothetical protein